MTVQRIAVLALLGCLLVPAAAFAHGPHRGDALTLERLGDLDGDGIKDIAIVAEGAPGPQVWIILLNADGSARTHQLWDGSLEDLRANPPAIDAGAVHGRERPASATTTRTAEPPSGFAPKGELQADGPPIVLCRDAAVSLDFVGEAEITPDLLDAGSYDDEGPITLTVTPASFTCADVGPNPVTLEVTDSAGQVSICEAVVTVVDDEPPWFTFGTPWFHLDASGTIALTDEMLTGYDPCGIASRSWSEYSIDACAYLGPNRDEGSFDVDATMVDVNGNTTTQPVQVNFYVHPTPMRAEPQAQAVQYGDFIESIGFSFNEDPCNSFFVGIPSVWGFVVDQRGPGARVSGQMWVPVGSYWLEGSTYVSNGGGGFGAKSLITVLPELAAVAFSKENPSAIPVPESETASFSVDMGIIEAESEAPTERDRAGDISLAGMSATLVSMDGSSSIPGTTTLQDPIPGTPDPESPFDYDRLPVTAAFQNVPPGVYLLRAEVTGDYYEGTGTEFLTVTDGTSEDFITGSGHFTWPGTVAKDYPGDRTTFSFKAGFPGASLEPNKGHLRITRHLKDGRVIRLESDDIRGPVVGAPSLTGLTGSFSGMASVGTDKTDTPFAVFVTDGGDQAPDRIWIATGRSDLSMADLSANELPAPDPIVVTRGSIVVHGKGGRPWNSTGETAEAGIFPRVIAPTLFQNAPNPFIRSTRIAFQIAEAAHVQLSVFDVRGSEVARLVDRPLPSGWHEATFAADILPAGVYFYRVQAGSFNETRRMTLLR